MERGIASLRLTEHLCEQTGVAWIVFDEENPRDRNGAHIACREFGSFTLVSQKSLMLFTSVSKASSCTGLVR